MTKAHLVFPALLALACCATAQPPSIPVGLTAVGYESHVELRWQANPEPNVSAYKIFRSINGGASFDFLKQVANTNEALDWTGDEGQNLSLQYNIKAVSANAAESDFSAAVSTSTQPLSDEELFDMVQRATFRYFWDFGHPVSGMARERNTTLNTVTTGGSGFGIMAIVVGAERGWVTREAAVDRMIQIVSFLQFADRFHGVFPHWMNGANGNVQPFSQFDDGGDLVETAFLMQGLLAARQYFDQNTPLESALRNAITGLWEDVEWDWYRRNNSGVLYWHWSPNYQWQMNFALRGFNEAHIVYLLAIASPTHPVPPSLYTSGWASANYTNPSIHFGYPIYCGPFAGGPLFFAHYSYLGFDPRGKRDQFCNYFVRNRNHALIHNKYCIANPEHHLGYSADCWGLTASDDPFGYLAHDPYPTNDNGTISPTAALASMPYTPQESMAALRHFYRVHGERLWGPYGFYDAFNLDQNWFATSYLAIDQGPIIAMMENQRTGLLWDLFMQNPEIQPALDTIGFQSDNSRVEESFLAKAGFDVRAFPNPVAASTGDFALEFSVLKKQKLTAQLADGQGRVVRILFQDRDFVTGFFREQFPIENLPRGIYFLEIKNESGERWAKKIVMIE